MTFSKLKWVKAITIAPDLTTTAKMVGIALGNYTNSIGENAHPGTRRLASDLQTSTKTIERNLTTLRSAGWVALVRRSNDAGRRNYADVYRLQTPTDRPTPVSADQEVSATDSAREPADDRQTFGSDRQTFQADRPTPVSDQQIFTNRSFNHQIVAQANLSDAREEKELLAPISQNFETEKLRQQRALQELMKQTRTDDEKDAS